MNFCYEYNQLNRPIISGSARARITKQDLRILSESLNLDLSSHNFPNLCSSFSKGSGNFPRVPWIAFHIKNKSVSNSLSVVICFSKDGCGIVCGLMVPSKLQSKLPTVNRINIKSDKSIFLDVNGSPRSTYNNKFINPKDFYKSELSREALFNHLTESIRLLYFFSY